MEEAHLNVWYNHKGVERFRRMEGSSEGNGEFGGVETDQPTATGLPLFFSPQCIQPSLFELPEPILSIGFLSGKGMYNRCLESVFEYYKF